MAEVLSVELLDALEQRIQLENADREVAVELIGLVFAPRTKGAAEIALHGPVVMRQQLGTSLSSCIAFGLLRPKDQAPACLHVGKALSRCRHRAYSPVSDLDARRHSTRGGFGLKGATCQKSDLHA